MVERSVLNLVLTGHDALVGAARNGNGLFTENRPFRNIYSEFKGPGPYHAVGVRKIVPGLHYGGKNGGVTLRCESQILENILNETAHAEAEVQVGFPAFPKDDFQGCPSAEDRLAIGLFHCDEVLYKGLVPLGHFGIYLKKGGLHQFAVVGVVALVVEGGPGRDAKERLPRLCGKGRKKEDNRRKENG